MILGTSAITVGRSYIKSKTQNKLPLYMCNTIFIIGMIIYISFVICGENAELINSNIACGKYPIQKLTLTNVYFNNSSYNFNESPYVILEEPNEDFVNVVIEEKDEYIAHWFFKIKINSNKYHVYLSRELYDRLQDGNVIYEEIIKNGQ